MRALARFVLTLALVVSLVMTLRTGAVIAAGPELAVFRDAVASEIVAATETALAEEATPEKLASRIAARLGEDPRDWVVIDALTGLAGERGIDLPPELVDRLQSLRDQDSGFLATAQACAACVMDTASCTVNLVLMCRAPIDLTLVGDLAGLARGGAAYVSGGDVDEVDLALSVVGLGATVLVLVSGGSSLAVKAGAGLAKIGRGMGRISDGLANVTRAALREGVDWAKLPSLRSVDEIGAVLRTDSLAPLVDITSNLTRLQSSVGTARALHLMPLVGDANSARRLANAAEALDGPRLVARAEMLGPARLLRATVRLTDMALGFAASLMAFLTLLAMSIVGAIKSAALRRLRRSV